MTAEDDFKEDSEKHKILIVDDNPNNLSVLDNFLKESGFTTLVATKGELALKRAEFTAPDLILLDVMMPGIDGFETCRRLKASAATKDIPVIFTTALASPEDKLKGFEVGGVDYVTKPIQHQEVLARVTTHLRIRDLAKRLEDKTAALTEANKEISDLNERLTEENLCMSRELDAVRKLQKMDMALKKSEARFSGLLERLGEAVFRMSIPDERYEYFSPAARSVFGYDGKDFMDNPLFMRKIIHPDFTDSFVKTWKKVLQGEVPRTYEYKIVDPDLRERWIFQTNTGVFDENREIIAMEGCCTDISDRKRAEEALRVSEKKYKEIAETLRKEKAEHERAEDELRKLSEELEQRIRKREGKYLIFTLSGESYGISILKIREILGMMPVTPVHNTPVFLKGVINLRGRVIPVADLRLRLGLESADYTDRTCIIVTELTGETADSENIMRLMGIVADSVSEVLNIKGTDIDDAPEFGIGLNTDYILGVARSEKDVKILINIESLFNAEEMG